MKKIYFACSIRGGRDDAATYAELVNAIKQEATVLSEIFADGKLTPQGTQKPSPEIWENDLAWVCEADAIIAEVTNPSLGVGYEIAKAEEWHKPILALYRPSEGRRLSAMIDGSPAVTVVNYTDTDEAATAISAFLQGLED